jgi:hypothetical protein
MENTQRHRFLVQEISREKLALESVRPFGVLNQPRLFKKRTSVGSKMGLFNSNGPAIYGTAASRTHTHRANEGSNPPTIPVSGFRRFTSLACHAWEVNQKNGGF